MDNKIEKNVEHKTEKNIIEGEEETTTEIKTIKKADVDEYLINPETNQETLVNSKKIEEFIAVDYFIDKKFKNETKSNNENSEKNDNVEVEGDVDPNNLNEKGSNFYDNKMKNNQPQLKPNFTSNSNTSNLNNQTFENLYSNNNKPSEDLNNNINMKMDADGYDYIPADARNLNSSRIENWRQSRIDQDYNGPNQTNSGPKL